MTAAAAQVGPPPDSVWGAAMAQLTPRTTIRVHRIGGGRVEGQFPLNYPVAALDSLWVRGNSAKRGAIIGAIPGAIVGAAYGVLANEVGCKDDGGSPCPEAIPLLAIAGGAVGAALGALIGSATPRWHRKVP